MSQSNNSIDQVFSRAREEGRGALIGFLTAGDPSPKYTPKLCNALIEGGVDILELGIPFSDPIADGRAIQAADVRALKAGTTPRVCLEVAKKVRAEHEATPIVFLSYLNPVLSFGSERFLEGAAQSGANGLIVPDLPPIGVSEFKSYVDAAARRAISPILLATPTTTKSRLVRILENSRGFVYLVSLLGVTGVRTGEISESSLRFISRVCRAAKGTVPVAVGFGISKPSHVRSVLKARADGVIVGSAFVNIVANNLDDIDAASKQLKSFTRALRIATTDK